ncbi:MBL fold metallo-hydrolase RNA specificity domain-containing protein [Catelliglobosispora koreensis]|uniref:MBL fold metallo-hydrolase RNA specificity domain-containing protein n=1 Tax=Catelliglobosispora koreensis TaxID=129052 RepID=UPI0003727A3E|nr:MBL fold metallo-hydrolase [Catelliglobosispora koreensis]
MRERASLQFLGAAGTVTGSKFLLGTASGKLLVDCGMYQGSRELRRRNWEGFPGHPRDLDAVVLSHAHLDHCGWLPRLVRHGYSGPIYCSPWTAKVAAIVLRDAAHLQEEDAEYAAKRGYSKHKPPLPLFDTTDAEKAIALFQPVKPGTFAHVTADLGLRLHRAGHILGSSTVEVHASGRTAVFSGDLGRDSHPLLNPPDPMPSADAVIIESTYGDEVHGPRNAADIAAPMRRTFDRGGSVLIPAFAIDRTPVLLMVLRELMHTGELPQVPVYVDSPMALAALEVYREALRSGDRDIRSRVHEMAFDPFDPGQLHLVHSPQESKRLNEPHQPCIIISASGMATGGRVVHHLEHMAPNPRHLILLPGYQVPGTRGRALLDGAQALKMFGGYVPVRAEVVGFNEFSAHADADGLMAWLRTAPREPQTCYVVHGEQAASETLSHRIHSELGWCAVVPRHAERVLI